MNDADRDAALPELHRVLRPGRRLFATTNSEANMLEPREPLRAATTYQPASVEDFSLERGTDELGRHFEEVRRYKRESGLHVPDIEPLVAHAASLPGVTDEQVADFADLADQRLADGPLVIRNSSGLFVARTR